MNASDSEATTSDESVIEAEYLRRLATTHATGERQKMLRELWRLRRLAADAEKQDRQLSC